MGIKVKELMPKTIFGLVMDHADDAGKNFIYYLVARGEGRAPKSTRKDEIGLSSDLQKKCQESGCKIKTVMEGHEHRKEIKTRVTITTEDGQTLEISETAKTDKEPDDKTRLRLEILMPEAMSQVICAEIIGKPLEDIISINGPLKEIIECYDICEAKTWTRGEKGYSNIKARLKDYENA